MEQSIYILTFHGLGTPERTLPDGEDRYWLSPSFFEAILDRVRNRPDIFITFDDSNSSDFTIALPALLKRQMRASFFVVSERIGQPGCLSAEQVQKMMQAGMTIGSHGTEHRPWAQLDADELHEELNASRKRLEEIVGRTVDEAACPFGSYNRLVLSGLRSAGYRRVYTSDQGTARHDEWLSARNTIVLRDTMQDVERIIESKPRGLPALLRKTKLTLKRWR